MPMLDLFKKLGVVSEQLQSKPLAAVQQPNAATAETITINIPTDLLLYQIDLECFKATATLADNINEVRLIIDGNKVVRKIRGGMIKALATLNKNKPSTGFYPLYITDPKIDSDPLPLWGVTSAVLEIDLASAGGSDKNSVIANCIFGSKSSLPRLSNITLANVLFEKYITLNQFGAVVGEDKYTHERTQGIHGYLYETGDNGTLADTTFDYVTLELNSPQGTLQPYYKYRMKVLKEKNTQETNGNALPTGYFYLPFPDKLTSGKYTSIYSFLNAVATPTNAQVRVLERYVIGG